MGGDLLHKGGVLQQNYPLLLITTKLYSLQDINVSTKVMIYPDKTILDTLLYFSQSLIQIINKVVNVLCTNGKANSATFDALIL